MLRLISLILISYLLHSCYAHRSIDDIVQMRKSLSSSIVMLTVTKQNHDIPSPWNSGEITQGKYYGTVVRYGAKNRLGILSLGAAAEFTTNVQMKIFGDSRAHQVKVVFHDPEINLALFQPVNEKIFEHLTPLTLVDDEESPEDYVEVVGRNIGGQWDVFRSQIKSLIVTQAGLGTYQSSLLQLDTAQKDLRSASPVLKEGKLTGIINGVFHGKSYMTPSFILRHFLEDRHEESKYKGFPDIGFFTQSLVSATEKKSLLFPENKVGARIVEVEQFGPFAGKLQKNDILLSINGIQIDEEQRIDHSAWGKIPYMYLLNRMYAKEKTLLILFRKGQELKVEGTLERYDSNSYLVLDHERSNHIPHLIFGGLVFQELSREYMKSWGKDWATQANANFLYYLNYKNDPNKGQQRIIVLNTVLGDFHNRGYEKLNNQMVESVNGVVIHSLADLKKALNKPIKLDKQSQFMKLKLGYGAGTVVLSYNGIADAHARIKNNYSILSDSSFFNPDA